MENVPTLTTFRNGEIYQDFLENLKNNDYEVSPYPAVYCPDYGIPQRRKRLVLFASKPKYGKIKLSDPTHTPDKYKTVKDVISDLEPLEAGDTSPNDPYSQGCWSI